MKPKLRKLSEQTIVITGASSGIGLATALRAGKRGANVVLVARNETALADAAQRIAYAGGRAIHVVADVASRADLEQVAARATEEFGGFDTWVNNAGLGIYGALQEVSDADNRRLFDVNFWGLVYGSTIAAAHLKQRGGGALINLGSVVSDVAFPVQGMYCASKHAIKGYTDSLRMELEGEGAPVSVTLIKPASIDTPFPVHAKNYTSGTPSLPPPVYAPEDVADAILYAAEHGGRDYYIGGGGRMMSGVNRHLPQAIDWMGAHVVPRLSILNTPSRRDPAGNLHAAVADGHVRGDSARLVRRSAYTQAKLHPLLAGAVLAGVGLSAAATLIGRPRS